jgi:NADH-quinone oxidoreductase subunit F
VSGASTVTQAMSYGKRAAKAIDDVLSKSPSFNALFTHFEYQQEVPAVAMGGQRRNPEELPIPDRSHNFHEVVCGYCEDDLHCETSRCMRCDVKRKD